MKDFIRIHRCLPLDLVSTGFDRNGFNWFRRRLNGHTFSLLVFDESQRNYQNYESVLWCNTQLEKISFTADVYDPKVDVVSTREVVDPNGDELLRIYIALAQIFLSNFLYPIFLLYPNSLILITLLNSLKLISFSYLMYEKIALQELSLKIMHYFIILLEMYARSRNKAKFARWNIWVII
uniref:Uncharacterized protein n=1 Tax=Rhizophagus irregularis (strain DAOM 181602 / DAOM 197198 / MUCL 43194) TaxID=747089 RepID=U9SYS9_RHIID